MAKVSIIVPIYNVEKYLRQCLDSIIAQTLKDIEIILVDDGSPDNCPAICDEYAAKDARIRVIHKANAGYGAACNRGIAEAASDYIGFVESDDWIEPDMFEILYKHAVENNLDVVRSNYNKFLFETRADRPIKLAEDCLYGKVITPAEQIGAFKGSVAIWTGLYRAEFLKENNIKFLETPGASYQDTSFRMKTLLDSKRVMFIDYAGYHYTVDNFDSSVKSNSKIFEVCKEFYDLEKRYEKIPSCLKIINSIKFNVFAWNYNRLNKKGKKEFKKVYKNEFKNFYEKGLFEETLLEGNARNTYEEITKPFFSIFSITDDYSNPNSKHKKITILNTIKFKFKV